MLRYSPPFAQMAMRANRRALDATPPQAFRKITGGFYLTLTVLASLLAPVTAAAEEAATSQSSEGLGLASTIGGVAI